MDADKVLSCLGGWGKYQYLTYALLGFVYIRGAWPVLAILFIGGNPGHQCYIPPADNSTGRVYPHGDSGCSLSLEVDGHNISKSCIYGYQYGDAFQSTIMSDFDLVCEKDYMVDLSSTIYMVGNAFGAVMITPLADKFGRKWVMLACLWIQGVLGTGVAFANSYILFTCLRFMVGFLNMAIALICYVMIAELFPSDLRTRPSIGVSIGWSLGIISLALFGYLVPNWRHLELLISLPNFLTVFYIWFLSESISWLTSQHRYKQLREVLQRITRMNCLSQSPTLLLVDHEADSQETRRREDQGYREGSTGMDSQSQAVLTTPEVPADTMQKYSLLDLFRTTKMRRYSLIMFYLWFVNSLGYFGILFSTPALHGNIYVNLAISGAVEIPAILICVFVLEKIGRRKPLVVFMLLCGVMNIVTVLIPPETGSGTSLVPLLTTLAMVGKFGISGSYSTAYLMSTEIFPTVIRNQAVGLSSFFENLGSIAAPFIVYGAKNFEQMPLVLFGVLTLIGGLLALILPETHNMALPETISDVESNKNDRRYCGSIQSSRL